MSIMLPALLNNLQYSEFPVIVQDEKDLLSEAKALFDGGFYGHALLDIWNAAVHNLRRRVEAYSIDIFISTVKDEPGRKKIDKNGESLAERWSGVDDLVLISGATRLGLLNPKAGKALDMINWMRNHASPAHSSDNPVTMEDVIGLVLILQKNLFEENLPTPGHSISSLFEPIKKSLLTEEALDTLRDQIRGLRVPDIRGAFGYMLDIIANGEDPAYSNTYHLFPSVWELAPDELKKIAGVRYHSIKLTPDTDTSHDKKADDRLLYLLTHVGGIKYIPDGVRAAIYRRAAKQLSLAKNTSYGWKLEESAAAALAEFGPHVPQIAFIEVYQEIIATWCGNYWG